MTRLGFVSLGGAFTDADRATRPLPPRPGGPGHLLLDGDGERGGRATQLCLPLLAESSQRGDLAGAIASRSRLLATAPQGALPVDRGDGARERALPARLVRPRRHWIAERRCGRLGLGLVRSRQTLCVHDPKLYKPTLIRSSASVAPVEYRRLTASQRAARARRFCCFFRRAARLRAVFRRFFAGMEASYRWSGSSGLMRDGVAVLLSMRDRGGRRRGSRPTPARRMCCSVCES